MFNVVVGSRRKKIESEGARGRWSHSPFSVSSSSCPVPWAGIRLEHNKVGLLCFGGILFKIFFPPFRQTQNPRFLFPYRSNRHTHTGENEWWEDDVVFGMLNFLYYTGATPFTFENRKGEEKKTGRSNSWRKVHRHKRTQMLHRHFDVNDYTTAIFLFLLLNLVTHENRDLWLKMIEINLEFS